MTPIIVEKCRICGDVIVLDGDVMACQGCGRDYSTVPDLIAKVQRMKDAVDRGRYQRTKP